MNSKRILGAGVLVWIVSSVFGWLTCGWLFNWVYAIEPIIWKDPSVITSAPIMLGSNLVGLIGGIVFALIYAFIYKGIPKKGVKKGMVYGLVIWIISVFLGIAAMPFYMTIANTVVIYWIIQALVINLINGAIVGAVYKEK